MAGACSAVDMIGLLGAVSAFVTAVVALAALSLWSRQLTHPPRLQWINKAIEASGSWGMESIVVLHLDAQHKKPDPFEMVERLTEAWKPLVALFFYAVAESEQCEDSLDAARWKTLANTIGHSRAVFVELQAFINGSQSGCSIEELERKIGKSVVEITAAANALSYVRAPWQFD